MASEKKIIADIYNAEGSKIGERELSAAIFGIEIKKGLLHLAVVAQAANARTAIASVKTRADVRGGGKKPWKQKGTGRARHGSIRSPIWRGGGVVWGPTSERNFELKMNRKVKQKALCMALSQKANEGRILLVEMLPQTGKTKDAAQFLLKLPIKTGKKKSAIAVISPLGAKDTNRGLRNISNVTIVPAHSLNVIDILKCQSMVMPIASLDSIEKKYAKTA